MTALAALPLTAAVALAVLVFGDEATAAVVGGAFAVLNTCLNAWLLRRQAHTQRDVRQTQTEVRQTREVLTAPRRAVYDAQGDIIGTVLKLEHEPWRAQVVPPQRATDVHQGEAPRETPSS